MDSRRVTMQTATRTAVRHGALARVGAALALALAMAFANLGFARAIPLDVPTGLGQLLAAYQPTELARGIATFGAVPTAGQASGLAALGLSVQRLQNLPLGLVYGPVSAMQAAATAGLVNDVYPDT